MIRILCFAALGLFLFAHQIAAHSAKSGDISIGHVWALPMAEGADSIEIYGPFVNNGDSADAITSVETTIAKSVKLAPQMAEPAFDLLPGKLVSLNQKRQFLKLSGLSKSYKDGDKFPITLHFKHAPPVTIEVMVQAKKTY
jgi:periplasmic copper chaperone A